MIDIIIVNYHSTQWLLKSLESIRREDSSLVRRVVVCENGSDDLRDRLEASFPRLHYIKNNKNLGFAAAVNIGIRKGDAPYMMLLNPDTRIAAGFFEMVCAYLERNPRVGVLGPKVLNEDGTVQGSARSFPTPMTGLFGRTSFLTRVFPENRISRKNMRTDYGIHRGKTIPVDWVSGACMIVRREAAADVGLLDERFFMYWEDADWCRRIKSAGWQVVYFPAATIVHAAGKSSDKRRMGASLAFHLSAYRYCAKYAAWPLSMLNPVVFMALALRFYAKCIGTLFTLFGKKT